MLRQVITIVTGHVDHGKTTILDRIRNTAIAAGEAGGITQSISSTFIPLEKIKAICGPLLESLKMKLTIPGILCLDSPGHEAFTNLRIRGSKLADIAILVVDINEGFKPQTIEVIKILKEYKTPFLLAANKIDLIAGWKSNPEKLLLQSISSQSERTRQELDNKLYELVGKLSEHGLNSERFDRVDDFTKQIAIVPCCAKTGEGIPELLMVMAGMAQKFLETSLTINVDGPAKGTILEVKEEKGLGKTLDCIIYDGKIRKNDTIVIGGINAPIVTKVRALLIPKPLSDSRERKASNYTPVEEVSAAIGVKISAPGIEEAVAGMPVLVANENLDKIKKEVQEEVSEILIETDNEGIVVNADTLGSLEALVKLLKDRKIKIKKASIGEISKKDVSAAASNQEKDALQSVVLGFNVNFNADTQKFADDSGVRIFTSKVIYQLIDDFDAWRVVETQRKQAKELEGLVMPCKLELMRSYVFRQSNPAIVGVDILEGSLRTGTSLMKDGKTVGVVKAIQQENENITTAEKGKQVAVSIDGATVGRQINEGDILYSVIPDSDFRKLKELKHLLKKEEIGVLKEIAELMRKSNPLWGV